MAIDLNDHGNPWEFSDLTVSYRFRSMDVGVAADEDGSLLVHGAEDNPIWIQVTQEQANIVRALATDPGWTSRLSAPAMPASNTPIAM